ncbi:hypothetical protein P7H12_26130 [Paenibacillus larvae]|nr:hypothetical protein [Paenibacillus larvae]MDT2266391.1 hypothetical protein [Paenibacillus larvae]
MTWTGTEWLKRNALEELIRKYTELIDAMARIRIGLLKVSSLNLTSINDLWPLSVSGRALICSILSDALGAKAGQSGNSDNELEDNDGLSLVLQEIRRRADVSLICQEREGERRFGATAHPY